jgi:hypothetical protein
VSFASLLPGAIRQNGYVVRDLDRAIASMVGMGVGPWFVLGPMTQDVTFRGTPAVIEIRIAFANSGALQMELIEQRNDAPSPYTEFLATGREGFHHLAWWADDYDAFDAEARACSFPIIMTGNAGGVTRYCYGELDGVASTAVEVMELNDATRWMATTVHDAAVGWDGRDPVRSLL